MKSFRLLGIGAALLTVLAFSAMFVVASASAVPTFLLALWLNNGAIITSDLLAEAAGVLILTDLEAGVLKLVVSAECGGILDGFVGPESFDEITEVLNSETLASISQTPLTGTSIACLRVVRCENGKAWAVHLPWITELELWEEAGSEGFVELLLPGASGLPVGWYVECTVAGVTGFDECTTSQGVAEGVNVVNVGVEALFSEAITLLFGAKLASCTESGNKETGVVEGKGTIKLAAGGPLSASE